MTGLSEWDCDACTSNCADKSLKSFLPAHTGNTWRKPSIGWKGGCLTSAEAKWGFGNLSGQASLPLSSGRSRGAVKLNTSLNRSPVNQDSNSVLWEQVLRNSQTNFCSDYILINTLKITFQAYPAIPNSLLYNFLSKQDCTKQFSQKCVGWHLLLPFTGKDDLKRLQRESVVSSPPQIVNTFTSLLLPLFSLPVSDYVSQSIALLSSFLLLTYTYFLAICI